MKKHIKLFGLIALAALIGLTACKNDDDGPRNVPASIRFTNTASGARAAIAPHAANGLTAAEIFPPYAQFYQALGTKCNSCSITPTKFEVHTSQIGLFNRSSGINMLGGQSGAVIVDFANPVTIQVDEVQSGFYNILNANGITVVNVVFTLPVCIVNKATAKPNMTVTNNVAEAGHSAMDPSSINGYLPAAKRVKDANSGEMLQSIPLFIYGPEQKILMIGFNGIEVGMNKQPNGSDIFPDFPWWQPSLTVGGVVSVPWAGIEIPDSAQSVTFEIIWDTNGIIEHYKNPANDTNTDYFVLKDGWWNALGITAHVN